MIQKSIKQVIIEMSSKRTSVKTVCPSEIARAIFPEDWRSHMDEVRSSAIELHKEGLISITQQGVPIDADYIKGPVRIKINRPVHE